jgi:hypothetical protein
MAIGWLDVPGSRLPVSNDPSFNTTRCVMLSMLCHTTIWPAGNVAGLGEKDCAPLIATTLIVTAPGVGVGVGVGTGVGVGVGAGVVGGGVGEDGPEVLELPQPQAPRLNATMALATNTRILIPFCCYGRL